MSFTTVVFYLQITVKVLVFFLTQNCSFISKLIIYYSTIKFLCQIWSITFSFSFLDSLLVLCSSLICMKLNMLLPPGILLLTQPPHVSRGSFLHYNRLFINYNSYIYTYILKDVFILNIIYRTIHNGFITCPSLLKVVNIRVPAKNIRGFNRFCNSFSRNRCPFRSTLAAVEACNTVNTRMSDNHSSNISLLVND